ncbi:MAG: serine/threonine protein kinase [Proteobacteria bacterium]|nr:serine/threonine protein kinase [Pseudomonadota bacterium]
MTAQTTSTADASVKQSETLPAQTAQSRPAQGYDIAYDQEQKTGFHLSDDEPPKNLTPPELADKYTFVTKLGEGTQGKVYLAKRKSDGQKVAIKQLQIDSVKNWKEYTLFHREADMLAKLNMTGVAKFYEACEFLDANPPCSYIVQEYIEGPTIKEILSTGTRLSLDRVYDLALQIIDILEKLHKHDPPVIHRDIKPSNIILKPLKGDNFQAYLIDFGAVANPQVQAGGSTIAGTFGYMSPEQNIGQPTPQSDTYALAALLAYLISGVNPADMKIQDLRLIIDPYVENHPPALVQTLRRMLEPVIANRLADYGELRKRFTEFKNGQYVLKSENRPKLTQRALKKRLSEVKYLCQPQNLEVWEALPDLPQNRPDFPLSIRTKSRVSYARPILKLLVCIATGLALCTALWMVEFPFIGLLIAFIFIIAGVYMLTLDTSRLQRKKDWQPHVINFAQNDINMNGLGEYNTHPLIYKYGRKTIATITDIYYVPFETNDPTENQSDEPVLQSPIFRIYYKFNPPDDESLEDIVHTVETHIMPDGKFKIGDPLPILYAGQMDPSGVLKNITSIPFPFPTSDMETKYDYICTNLTRQTKQ